MDRFQSQSDRFPKRKRKTGDCRLGSGEFGGGWTGRIGLWHPIKKGEIGSECRLLFFSFHPVSAFCLWIVCGSHVAGFLLSIVTCFDRSNDQCLPFDHNRWCCQKKHIYLYGSSCGCTGKRVKKTLRTNRYILIKNTYIGIS